MIQKDGICEAFTQVDSVVKNDSSALIENPEDMTSEAPEKKRKQSAPEELTNCKKVAMTLEMLQAQIKLKSAILKLHIQFHSILVSSNRDNLTIIVKFGKENWLLDNCLNKWIKLTARRRL